jgi:hypothetical protein
LKISLFIFSFEDKIIEILFIIIQINIIIKVVIIEAKHELRENEDLRLNFINKDTSNISSKSIHLDDS